jgi:protein SCO1/2
MKRALLLLFLLPLGALGAAPAPAGVGFEQRNGEQLPLTLRLMDGNGVTRPLGAYLGTKPVVLIFNYFRCPEMCSLVSSGALDALRALRVSAGKDYEVLTVSIDPTDTAAMAREREQADVARYGRTGAAAGWHTLVGPEDQVAALANAAGFHYRFDPQSRQYAHPSGLVILTPRGVVSRYFMGVDFPAQDLATALREAAANETGPSVFSLLFVCFQGGASQGQYSRLVWIALWAGVALTLAAVFGGIAWMLRQERRASAGGAG